MNETRTGDNALAFGRMAPTLAVTDIGKALDFYCGVLGFRKVFANGDPVGFVILMRDAAELHLTLNKAHKATVQNIAALEVNDASALYDHLSERGVRIVKGIRDADYGLRTFVFADPDGNRVDVGEEI